MLVNINVVTSLDSTVDDPSQIPFARLQGLITRIMRRFLLCFIFVLKC